VVGLSFCVLISFWLLCFEVFFGEGFSV